MSGSHNIDRRDFVKVVLAFLGTIMGAVIGLPAIGYLISPAMKVQQKEAWIPLGPLEKYPVGMPTLFSFTRTTVNGWEKTVNSFGAYVVRSSESALKVYSNMCTHLSCRVTWKEELQEYVCPCHDGHFDAEGRVTLGPPPKPLYEYETKIEDGNLFIHFTEG
ncbi:MAG TPA: ubiquinol-cytochrome c reductase iron-sulfur subunit [Anaerolineales bacterium]|nr:ubiquinol-cytochrome c reductase iron-sulfur subunit [Anaerolineales bacterium]